VLGSVEKKLRRPHLYGFRKYLSASKEFLAAGIVMRTVITG